MPGYFDPTTINPKFIDLGHKTLLADADAIYNLRLQVHRQRPLIAVEIGSFLGTTALVLAKSMVTPIDTVGVSLFCIDTWEGTPGEDSVVSAAYRDMGKDGVYRLFLQNVGDYLGKVITPLKLPSVVATELPQMHDLDLVFIDADHSYDSCYNDIAAWLPRVRPGGVIAGHDYGPAFPGVEKAVREFPELEGHEVSSFVWWKQLPLTTE